VILSALVTGILLLGDQCYDIKEMPGSPANVYCHLPQYSHLPFGPYKLEVIQYTQCSGKMLRAPGGFTDWVMQTRECPTDLVAPAPVSGLVYDGPNSTLSWSAPTLNADDSPLTDLKEYRIYCGLGNVTIPVGTNVWVIPAILTGLTACAITAVNESGNESVTSEVVGFHKGG